MALGWGFSFQLCPDRSSLSTGLGRGQALPTLLAVMQEWEAGLKAETLTDTDL